MTTEVAEVVFVAGTFGCPLRGQLCGNGDFDLNTSLDVDDDLLDNLGRSVEIDEALVDAHLIHVPGLGTLTARGLSGGDLEGLGGQSDGSLDAQVLRLCTLQQLAAHLLQRLHLSARQGDTDLVDFLSRNRIMLAHVFFALSVNLCVYNCRGAIALRFRGEGLHTGPSPKSFSGFWKDMVSVCGVFVSFCMCVCRRERV